MRYWSLAEERFMEGELPPDQVRDYSMADAELFAALGLDGSGLEDVRDAVRSEDYGAAREAYLRYFNERKPQVWLFDPKAYGPFMKEHFPGMARITLLGADQMVGRTGKFFLDAPLHRTADGEYDWFHTGRLMPGNYLFSDYFWSLYMFGRAFMLTGDAKYAESFQSYFNSWYETIGTTPVERHPKSEILDGGQRNMRLIDGLFALKGSGRLTARTLTNALKVLLVSNRKGQPYYMSHPGNTGWKNGQYAGVCTTIATCAAFPEFKESAEWMERCKQRLREALLLDTYEDGGQLEPSSNYHETRMRDGFYAWCALEFNGVEREFLREIAPAFEKLNEFSFYTATPPGNSLLVMDGYHTEAHLCLLPLAVRAFRRGDFEWLRRLWFGPDVVPTQGKTFVPAISAQLIADLSAGSAGVEPEPPRWTSHYFEQARTAIMRQSWEHDALYASVYCGRSVPSHAHPGTGFIEVWCHGRPLIGSCGYFHGNPEEHMMVHLPGVEMPDMADVRTRFWRSGEAADVLSFEHDGYLESKGVAAGRVVACVKDAGYLAIFDRLAGPIQGQSVRWSGTTLCEVQGRGSRFVCRDKLARGVGLLVVPIPSRGAGELIVEETAKADPYSQEQLARDLPRLLQTEWASAWPLDQDQQDPASRISFEKKAGRRGASFFVVLMPFRGRMPKVKGRRLVGRSGLEAYLVEHEKGTDLFLLRTDGKAGGLVGLDRYRTDAQAAIVCQRPERTTAVMVAPGALELDGTQVLKGRGILHCELTIEADVTRLDCELEQYSDVILPGRYESLKIDGTEETEYLGEDAVSMYFYKPGLHTIEARRKAGGG